MPIVLSHVTFAYQPGRPVIRDADLSIRPGQMVGLFGPSGSGKTTLLQLVGGLLHPTTGSVTRPMSIAATRWIFQVPTALGRRSVRDNVLIGLHEAHLPKSTTRHQADAVIEAVGLTHAADQSVRTLSGGELQRMQVARALVSAPALVIADEPTGQLDRTSTITVVDALQSARGPQSTVVVATHDPLLAAACDRLFAITDAPVREVAAVASV